MIKMGSPRATYIGPTIARYKPLVLVVQSAHFEPAENKAEFDAMLTDIGDAVYTRSRLISVLAGLYPPVNIHLDSVGGGYAELLNIQLNRYKDDMSIDEFPDGPSITHRSLFEYHRIRDDLVDFFQGKRDSPERVASELSDYVGLISMLSTFALHGSEIKIMPYDHDSNLVRESINGNRKLQVVGAKERDDKLYEFLVRNSNGDDTTSILFTGGGHEIERLRTSSFFDSSLIQVGFSDSTLAVIGALPYEEGVQYPDEMKDKITRFLKEGGLEVIVDINFEPRQLIVTP